MQTNHPTPPGDSARSGPPSGSLVAAAVDLGRHGLRVHPTAGKLPLLKNWPSRATTDERAIRELWARYPHANVGIATGDDGLFVVDIDVAKGGEESASALTAQWGRFPRTPTVRTGSGGWHLYLKAPFPVRNSCSKLGSGIDLRGVGGQVVAPPSLHPNGHRYAWLPGLSPADVDLAPAPGWLQALIREPAPTPVRVTSLPPGGSDLVERARRYIAAMPAAISGSGGHHATWKVALVLVRGFCLSTADALALLLAEYNPRCEPPWSERELRHKVACAAEKSTVPAGFLRHPARAS